MGLILSSSWTSIILSVSIFSMAFSIRSKDLWRTWYFCEFICNTRSPPKASDSTPSIFRPPSMFETLTGSQPNVNVAYLKVLDGAVAPFPFPGTSAVAGVLGP